MRMSVETLAEIDVSNVYVYVGDAVRYDYRPKTVCERGISIRTIAASTHSPASFASLVTGRYPPQHGVETFAHRLGDDVPRLFDVLDVETGFRNSIFAYAEREHSDTQDPIYTVLDLDQSRTPDVGTVTSPFVVVERGPGGHAPYGDFDGTASQYFHERTEGGPETIRSDYARSVERDVELFERRLQTLADRGLLHDTLVVYTSDHGEMLGENGLLGHNGPMRPELVYVPTVFIHPELASGETPGGAIHHVDLLPTVCEVLGRATNRMEEVDGRSVLSGVTGDPRPCFWSNRFLSAPVPLLAGTLRYTGTWDAHGGHVFAETGRGDRLAILAGKLLKSSKRSFMRRNLGASVRAYLRGDATYGTPGFSRAEAERVLEDASRDPADSVDAALSEGGRRRLKDLGYME